MYLLPDCMVHTYGPDRNPESRRKIEKRRGSRARWGGRRRDRWEGRGGMYGGESMRGVLYAAGRAHVP